MIKIILAFPVIRILVDIYLLITLEPIVDALLIHLTVVIHNAQFAQIYVGNVLRTKLSAQVVKHQILDNCQDLHVFVQRDCNHRI